LVTRLYLRELVTFHTLELQFEPGLVVFTGPSGAGKSVLLSAILSSFGYVTQGAATLCEVTVSKPSEMKSEAYLLEEEITVKTLKKEKLRYFMDGQNISKKALAELFRPYVRYLSVRDRGGVSSEELLELIDTVASAGNRPYGKLLKSYRKRYAGYQSKLQMLEKIKADEAKLSELIEFTRYEIEKIEQIDPKPGEEEELLTIKQQLSRIDKIREAMERASQVFQFESSVEELYRLLEKEHSLFSEAMNQLREEFEETRMLADELESVDVERVLDRLSDVTALKNRYGSLEEALAYKNRKKEELAGYENIAQDKSMLVEFLESEYRELEVLAGRITRTRREAARWIETEAAAYLESLKLPKMHLLFNPAALCSSGADSVEILLGNSLAATLSGGEFNRLRLALMAVGAESSAAHQGVLILDEIDANVSGDESIAIATLISKLASCYQVFAISHQPHLSAKADQHIVVRKERDESRAEVLNASGRVDEIARIIAGEKPTEQAVAFARKLRDTGV